MIGDRSRLISLVDYGERNISYGDNRKAQIIGKGCISGDQMPTLNDVFLVEGLKHNLLSIGPLCDKGNKVV